jgi:hypothetical protein
MHVIIHIHTDTAVDPDQFALKIEQGTAAVSSDQRAIGDDGRIGNTKDSTDSDNGRAVRHPSTRMATSDAPLTDFESFIHGGQGCVRPRLVVVIAILKNANESSIIVPIHTHADAFDATAVMKNDGNSLLRLASDVSGGKDVAVLIDHDTASLSAAMLEINGHPMDLFGNLGLLPLQGL